MCEAVNACTVLHLDAVLKRFTAEEVAAPVTVEVVATFPSGANLGHHEDLGGCAGFAHGVRGGGILCI